MAPEPPPILVDARTLQHEGTAYYVIAKADMDRLTAYVNALRLAFQENLISLRKCVGP